MGWLKIYPAQLVSIALIIFLTYTNTKGVKGGKWIQNIFTTTKLFPYLGYQLQDLIFFKPDVWHANWTNAWDMKNLSAEWSIYRCDWCGQSLGAIAASMVGSIFSSDAWNNVTFIAGEIKNPETKYWS